MAEIHLADGIAGVRDAGFRSALEPVHRQLAVHRRAQAVAMRHAELELRLGLALLGGTGEPSKGRDTVARNAFSPRIDDSELELRDGIASLRQRREQLDCPRIIAHDVSNERVRELVGAGRSIEQHEQRGQQHRDDPAPSLLQRPSPHVVHPFLLPSVRTRRARQDLLFDCCQSPAADAPGAEQSRPAKLSEDRDQQRGKYRAHGITAPNARSRCRARR
jgi:hypothetical protein